MATKSRSVSRSSRPRPEAFGGRVVRSEARPIKVVRLIPAIEHGDIYVGSTNGLRRRVELHKQGRVYSTTRFLPAALIELSARE